MGNTVETRNANEAEAEIERTDIAAARAKRGEGGRGHAQEIVTPGRGHHLVSVEELEVE